MALFSLDHGFGVMSTHEDGNRLPVDHPAPERDGPAAEPTGSVSEVDEDFRPRCQGTCGDIECFDAEQAYRNRHGLEPYVPMARKNHARPTASVPVLVSRLVAAMKQQNVQILQIRSDGQIKADDSPWHYPE